MTPPLPYYTGSRCTVAAVTIESMGVTPPCRDYWKLLEITGNYLRLPNILSKSDTLLSTELREGILHVSFGRGLDSTRVMAQFVQAAINKGHPLHVDGQ